MSRDSEPLAKAMALLERLDPCAPARVRANLDAFSPDAGELVLGSAFGDIVGCDGIDLRTREMLTSRCWRRWDRAGSIRVPHPRRDEHRRDTGKQLVNGWGRGCRSLTNRWRTAVARGRCPADGTIVERTDGGADPSSKDPHTADA